VRLLQGPYRYQFTYAQKGAGARQWRNNWPFPTRIPDLIRLEILDKRSDTLISPPMIVAVAADAELNCLSEKSKVCSPKSGGDLGGEGASKKDKHKDKDKEREGERERDRDR
jgi:general secretion pathway protein J